MQKLRKFFYNFFAMSDNTKGYYYMQLFSGIGNAKYCLAQEKEAIFSANFPILAANSLVLNLVWVVVLPLTNIF